MDPDPGKEIEVDPDADLDPERGLKWIRIRPNAVDPGGSGSGQMQWIRVDPDPDPKRWFLSLRSEHPESYLGKKEGKCNYILPKDSYFFISTF